MYRVEYRDDIEKDSTYDNALYNCLNNNDQKWANYYAYLKEKNDLCYNVCSITIDIEDIKNMKYESFSNGLLLSLYLRCKKDNLLEKADQVTIINNCPFSEELIYNIFKTDWLIDERLIGVYNSDLPRRKNYFEAMIEASEDRQDVQIQFRNKLFAYFLKTYEKIKNNSETKRDEKELRKEILH